MSVYGSTNSPAFKSNVKLCRAIEKQTILYDPNHEYHRKRLPSENCWDMVASETGVSVEKCKRRWRQIRNDYIRWMNTDDHRQRNGLKRPTFYLADELKFLKPHLSLSDISERDMDSSEREQASKSKSKEPAALEESYKDTNKDNSEAVDEQPLSKLKQTTKTQLESEENSSKKSKEEKLIKQETLKEAEKPIKADKLKEKVTAKEIVNKNKAENQLEMEESSDEEKDKDTEKGDSFRSQDKEVSKVNSVNIAVKKPEFFIKQSNKASPNCLIIGKKPSEIVPVISPVSFEPMADDCADETESLGGGRRLRRGAGRIKQLTIQKSATEQRLTRLQRRKSMTVAAANSLRSSTSPVKMAPLPRVGLIAKPAAAKIQPKSPTKPPTPKPSPATSRDDIFPRPRAAAPLAQQLVLARRPAALPVQQQPQQPQQSQQPQQTFPNRQPNIGRPPGPARMAVTPANRPFVVPLTPAPRATTPAALEPKRIPPAPVASSSSSPPLQRLVSSSNTLVISTTSCPVNSHNTSTISTSTSNQGVITASITASPIVTTAPSVMTIAKRNERSTQTETHDVFSDDHFLEMLRPQMREMNPRQKMHFKQKIFQALMETFDDATDFPNSGDVQHFNINTPSGYEHITDPELRLVRELVSMISAVKHTSLGSDTTPVPAKVVTALRTPINKTTQRVYRQSPGSPVTPVTAGLPNEDDRKLYRILPNNNNKALPGGYAYPSQVVPARKDSIDSNNSTRTTPGRVTFVVPGSSPKTSSLLDPLNGLFGTGSKAAVTTKASPGIVVAGNPNKEPLLVRQMGRRYSVCGSGAPGSTVSPSAVAVASGSIPPTANSIALETLKRRLANPSQSMVPPQQRARYSNSTQAQTAAGLSAIAPGNSLLVRRAVAGAAAQKQLSPPGGASVPQKSPQIASIQGGSFNSLTMFNSNGSPLSTSPPKRAMVIANVKDSSQQKTAVSAVRPGLQKATSSLQVKATSAPNLANLLGESRSPNPAQVRPKTTSVSQSQTQNSNGEKEREKSETAGIIAADYFDMSRLKREPQDINDDDILGM